MVDDNALIRRANSLLKGEAGAADAIRREGSRGTRRRRSFLASQAPTEPPAEPPAKLAGTNPAGGDDDLPVLTDIVLPAELIPAESLESIGARLRQALAVEIGQVIDQQLRKELPALLDAALEHAADQLQHTLCAGVEALVRDFLAPAAPTRPPHADRGDSSKEPAEQAPTGEPERPHDPV
jgi:hypothetical protein